MQRLSEEALRKLRQHRRKREIYPLLVLGAIAIAYWLKVLPADFGFYALAAIMLIGVHQVERRLDAAQLRLAQMHDLLDEIAGREPQDYTEAEIGAR